MPARASKRVEGACARVCALVQVASVHRISGGSLQSTYQSMLETREQI